MVYNVISTGIDWVIGSEARHTGFKILPRKKNIRNPLKRKPPC
jgi:hypothetical protein